MPAVAFPFIPGSERVNKHTHGQSPRAVISAPQTLCPLTFLQCLEGPHTEHENVKYRLVGDYKGPGSWDSRMLENPF